MSRDRAKRAREEGREIERNGRPPIFNKEDVTQLLARFHQIRDTEALTIELNIEGMLSQRQRHS